MQDLPPAIIQFTDTQKRILKIVDKLSPDCVPGHIIKTCIGLPRTAALDEHTEPLIDAGLVKRCLNGYRLNASAE